MDILNTLNHWIKKKFQEMVTSDEDGNTSIRVSIPDQVYDYDKEAQFVETIQNSVTTVAVQIEVPPNVTEYSIFHQTEDAIVYWGDEDVDNTYPILEKGDVIEIKGKEDFEIYMLTSTGTITVFVTSTVRN